MDQYHASALARVLACNGSIKLGGKRISPSEASSSDDKREGIAAHSLGMGTLSGVFASPFEQVGKQTPNGIFITSSMAEYVNQFVTNALSYTQFDELTTSGVETVVDFNVHVMARILARVDYWQWFEVSRTLIIHDFKYGFRLIEPQMNWTLIAYAIGVCKLRGFFPSNIKLVIHQPRPFHPDGIKREWPLTYTELTRHQEYLSLRLAQLRDELVTGWHCTDCPALEICHAATQAAFNAVETQANTVIPENMTVEQIENTMEILDRAYHAIDQKRDAIRGLAKHRLTEGSVMKNHQLEPALGNRQFQKHVTAKHIELLTGIDVSTNGIVSPAQAEARGVPKDIVKMFTERPNAGMRLVRRTANQTGEKLFGKQPLTKVK